MILAMSHEEDFLDLISNVTISISISDVNIPPPSLRALIFLLHVFFT